MDKVFESFSFGFYSILKVATRTTCQGCNIF
nr:MAG TPA: hypothetical protein [Caudoviricetes sp.]